MTNHLLSELNYNVKLKEGLGIARKYGYLSFNANKSQWMKNSIWNVRKFFVKKAITQSNFYMKLNLKLRFTNFLVKQLAKHLAGIAKHLAEIAKHLAGIA